MIESSKLGELIFFCRKIQKVSQHDLCSGLCSVSTLSRMEHGQIGIPILLAQALLQRLGVDIDRFELLLGNRNINILHSVRSLKMHCAGKIFCRQNRSLYDIRR